VVRSRFWLLGALVPLACWLASHWLASSLAHAEDPALDGGVGPSRPLTTKPPKKEDKRGGEKAKPVDPPRATPRKRFRLVRARAAELVVSLVNLWTREVLPVAPGDTPSPKQINRFLRCHFTGQQTKIDPRLINLVVSAARNFKSDRVEVISAFRAPKYNLMLRKKGREVAGGSNHMKGQAIDFRVPGTSTRRLRAFAIKAGLGGVGYYPRSKFIHADVGPRRTWKGR
jgi:hypothetical protein